MHLNVILENISSLSKCVLSFKNKCKFVIKIYVFIVLKS